MPLARSRSHACSHAIARSRRQRAFTLIELLVVILIVAILIAVALPSFLGQTHKAQDSVAQQRLATARVDAKAIWTAGGQSGYPALGSWNSAGSLLYQLGQDEPGLSFVNGTGGGALSGSGPIEVWYPSSSDGNEVAMCTESASTNVFCFVADEASGLTANTAAPAGQGSAVEADYSPATVALAKDVSASAASSFYVSATNEALGYCVANAVGSGASVSASCGAASPASYQYSSSAWPTVSSASSSSSASPVSAPANTTAPSITGSPQAGQALTASPGAWSGNPSSYTYQWEDCTTAAETSCTPIGGASGTQASAGSVSYTVQASDAGSYIAVSFTATNSGGTSAAALSAAAQAYGPQFLGAVAEGNSSGAAITATTNTALAPGTVLVLLDKCSGTSTMQAFSDTDGAIPTNSQQDNVDYSNTGVTGPNTVMSIAVVKSAMPAGDAITSACSGSASNEDFEALAFSGISGTVDRDTSQQLAGTQALTVGPTNPARFADEVAITAFSLGGGAAPYQGTFTAPGSPWTEEHAIPGSQSCSELDAAYEILPGTQSVTAAWSGSNSGNTTKYSSAILAVIH